MSTPLKDRLDTEELSSLKTAAILEFTEELFESDQYQLLEVIDSDQQQLFIVNRNERTLTVLSLSQDMALKKETLFTDRIISMKEYFEEYSLSENTPPRKIEITFMEGRTLLIEPVTSKKQNQDYQRQDILTQVEEDFENLIAALKSIVIL
ncbi:hypothetical protein SAMN05192559_10610 [Halobacillus karajensis]|uniref:Uncharacterized protein n=1 Tax=Halobacillus karajensis TaxID=195088 RepID=A0A024P6R9_9BACI|nr:hypothetical protein [Halobacillus karajensis]CDQ21214.1 hypothetical protein BN982_03580 [Halobacillus karajensis]CDQ24724.1 hypothetical protein BN983_03020 [Halobacillus karajensis]CDQ28916.1 hypothetical protein BN981_03234 [Halobacillus karajensis]SEH94759.1 hypothetical protein SAMN05192559_10610 [Halobacillus karajensis]